MWKRIDTRRSLPWVLGALSLGVLLLGGRVLIEVLSMRETDPRAPEPTTYVVSPVPIYGQLKPFELKNERDEAFGTHGLRGGLYILHFGLGPQHPEAPALRQRLTELHEALVQQKVPARIVVVQLGPSTPESRTLLKAIPTAPWTVLGGDVEPLRRQILTLVSLEEERAWNHLALLVDQAGGVRGFYDLMGEPHSLESLVEDARCVSDCGPVPALAAVAPGTVPEGAACANGSRLAKRSPNPL